MVFIPVLRPIFCKITFCNVVLRQKRSMANAERMLELVRAVIPPLSSDKHKGVDGRNAVVGGCKEYTGAPYFAAISSLKVGADLSHVFCTSDASPVIKSYSPELIVHPLLDSSSALQEISEWLPRMHSLVIGPGLGRFPETLHTVKGIIQKAINLEKNLVIDADGVYLLTHHPEIIRHYSKAILTPNAMEFAHLYNSVTGENIDIKTQGKEHVQKLSQLLGNVTILRKGASDIISNGKSVIICDEVGSPRRCGGQGDLLAGTMGVFSHWAHSYQMKLDVEPTLIAAYAACALTRRCNKLAFQKNGRNMITTDMIGEIHSSFSQLFPDYVFQ